MSAPPEGVVTKATLEPPLRPKPSAPRMLAQTLFDGFWYLLLPGALTFLFGRHLLLSPKVEGVPRWMLLLFGQHSFWGWALLFLLWSALLRYWHAYLAGSRTRTAADNSPRSPSTNRWVNRLWFPLALGAMGLALYTVRTSVVTPYRVLSGSMLPVLAPGDYVLANKLAYGFSPPWQSQNSRRVPRRGDMVVFKNENLNSFLPQAYLVKRVIGLPGDVVQKSLGYASINGWWVPTCSLGMYAYVGTDASAQGELRVEWLEDATYLILRTNQTPVVGKPYEVKPGEVYVLGDNRNNSEDSASWNFGDGGGVPTALIEGKVDTLLVGEKRDGTLDWDRALSTLGINFKSENVDATELRNNLAKCLAKAPKDTTPPKPEKAALSASR